MIRKLNDDGVLNLAEAIMIEAIRTYVNAKEAHRMTPDKRTKKHLDDARNFLLTTSWNVTGLTGKELVKLIDDEAETITTRFKGIEELYA